MACVPSLFELLLELLLELDELLESDSDPAACGSGCPGARPGGMGWCMPMPGWCMPGGPGPGPLLHPHRGRGRDRPRITLLEIELTHRRMQPPQLSLQLLRQCR